MHQPGVGQTKVRNQELHVAFLHRWQGPIIYSLPRNISRTLDWKWNKWTLNLQSNVGLPVLQVAA